MQEATTLDHTRVHLSTDHELTHDIRLELNKIVTGVAHLLLLNQNIGVNSQQEVHPARSPLPTGGSSQQEVHRPFATVIQDRTFGDQVHGPPHVSTQSQSEPPALLTSECTLGFPTDHAMTRVEQLESLITRTQEVEANLRDWGRIVLQDLLLAEDITITNTITNTSVYWPRKHPSQVTNNQRGGISSKCLS
jgi:hypothetical protein